MMVAGTLLMLGYAALAVLVLELFRWLPSWWPYWTAVTVGLAASVVAHYASAERLLLQAARTPGCDRPGSSATPPGSY